MKVLMLILLFFVSVQFDFLNQIGENLSTVMERAENFRAISDGTDMVLAGNVFLHPDDFTYVTVFYYFKSDFICYKIDVYGTEEQLSIIWEDLIKTNCKTNHCGFDQNTKILYLLNVNEECYIKPNIQGDFILTIKEHVK